MFCWERYWWKCLRYARALSEWRRIFGCIQPQKSEMVLHHQRVWNKTTFSILRSEEIPCPSRSKDLIDTRRRGSFLRGLQWLEEEPHEYPQTSWVCWVHTPQQLHHHINKTGKSDNSLEYIIVDHFLNIQLDGFSSIRDTCDSRLLIHETIFGMSSQEYL